MGASRSSTTAVGQAGEAYAAAYLMARGLRLLMRNYRCRGGEIDLIMADQQQLIFVEVRLRRSRRYGGAVASVDYRKQQRLRIAALHYLQRYRPDMPPCRFDLLALQSQCDGEWDVEWLQHIIES